MILKCKAPLRIGLAGGGTDVSPYCDMFGGAVINMTINLYAHATLEPLDNGKIILSTGHNNSITLEASEKLRLVTGYELLIGVYNKINTLYIKRPMSFKLTSTIDAPQGSGLGTSSTIVVALIGVFLKWLNVSLNKHEIATLAYDIERTDLQMSGGKQDQYAATFGGINFIEFGTHDKVIVSPLSVSQATIQELQSNMLLYFTSTQRLSAVIIDEQIKNVKNNNSKSIEAMHHLKEQALQMKQCLLENNINDIGTIFQFGWLYKKQMAQSISNSFIDAIYDTAMQHGATGGKISGAGGGGFMFFYCPNNTKQQVANCITQLGGNMQNFQIELKGLQ